MLATLIESFDDGRYERETPIEFDPETLAAEARYGLPARFCKEFEHCSPDPEMYVRVIEEAGQEVIYPAAFIGDDERVAALYDKFEEDEFVLIDIENY